MSEIKCQVDNCATKYRSEGDPPNLFYYGRGYIQLTGSSNYKSAGAYLFPNDPNYLFNNPGLVASDNELSWNVSFWFWKFNVHTVQAVLNGDFGASTNIVNGEQECGPKPLCNCNTKFTRFEYYKKVLVAFGLSATGASNNGC